MPTIKVRPRSATRKDLLTWLAQAMQYVPPNLFQLSPKCMCPPQWVKDAFAELKRNGVTYVAADNPKKKRRPPSGTGCT